MVPTTTCVATRAPATKEETASTLQTHTLLGSRGLASSCWLAGPRPLQQQACRSCRTLPEDWQRHTPGSRLGMNTLQGRTRTRFSSSSPDGFGQDSLSMRAGVPHTLLTWFFRICQPKGTMPRAKTQENQRFMPED